MKYTMLIFLINTVTQIILGIQIILDTGGNIELYLSYNDSVLNSIIGFIIITFNILIVILVHKRRYACTIILSVLLSSLWIIFFFNALINEHYKFLTPLLLLVAMIELIRTNYNLRLVKNE